MRVDRELINLKWLERQLTQLSQRLEKSHYQFSKLSVAHAPWPSQYVPFQQYERLLGLCQAFMGDFSFQMSCVAQQLRSERKDLKHEILAPLYAPQTVPVFPASTQEMPVTQEDKQLEEIRQVVLNATGQLAKGLRLLIQSLQMAVDGFNQ